MTSWGGVDVRNCITNHNKRKSLAAFTRKCQAFVWTLDLSIAFSNGTLTQELVCTPIYLATRVPACKHTCQILCYEEQSVPNARFTGRTSPWTGKDGRWRPGTSPLRSPRITAQVEHQPPPDSCVVREGLGVPGEVRNPTGPHGTHALNQHSHFQGSPPDPERRNCIIWPNPLHSTPIH